LYAYCGGDPVNYSDPMGTTIQVGNQTLSGNERPIWTNAGEKDVLLAAMIQSNNVYTFKDWNEVHAILGNQQNVDWLVKDLGLTSAQLNTRLLKYKYSNYNMQRISALVNERSSWGTLKGPSSADPGIRQLALIGGTSYQVAELNAVAMATSIPHVAVAVNGLEGIGNGLEGNYGLAVLNIGAILLSRSGGNDFESGIGETWAARHANSNTVKDFFPQAREIIDASKARYGDVPGLVAMDRRVAADLLDQNGFREILSPKPHGNSLLSTGPHDVYAIREFGTDVTLHIGETGDPIVRNAYWKRIFGKAEIDVYYQQLISVEGKEAAKLIEARYIKTFRKLFGPKSLPYNFGNH